MIEVTIKLNVNYEDYNDYEQCLSDFEENLAYYNIKLDVNESEV